MFAILLALSLAGPAAQKSPPATVDQTVLGYLNQTIGWYRQQGTHAQSATDPSDVVSLAEERSVGREVVALAFDFARAYVALHPQQASAQQASAGANAQAIARMTADAAARVQQLKTEIDQFQRRLERAAGRQRTDLVQRLAETKSELELALARQETVQAFAEFMSQGPSAAGSGLLAEIEELRRSVPEAEAARDPAKALPSVPSIPETRKAAPTGVLALSNDLIGLARKKSAIRDGLARTPALLATVNRLREPLQAEIQTTLDEGDRLAQVADTSTGAALQQRARDIDQLTARFKAQSAAAVLLGKQAVLLETHHANLKEWLSSVDGQYAADLRMLLLHLGLLVTAIAAILAASEFWRRATFRYVKDLRRRQQSLVIRRIVVAVAVSMMVAFSLASELGSLATFAGFITAGLAVALQNVILSMAAYFFLIGKYGIRIGDRVQIGGVTGDVLDIGLVRLHLMELREGGEPSGRVVVFSNAVLFQPSANFFKQIPGSNFAWHQVTLTLSAQTDYRAAEKRLMDAVEKVFEEYRESISRQHQEMSQNLSIAVMEPRPDSQLRLTESGLEMTIRFPAPLERASIIDDKITRALLDAIEREPKLKLLGSGTPTLEAVPAAS